MKNASTKAAFYVQRPDIGGFTAVTVAWSVETPDG